MKKIKEKELKVGMEVQISRRDETLETSGRVESIGHKDAFIALKNGSKWHIDLRRDGYWGGNDTEGYLVIKEKEKPPKPIKFVMVYDAPGCGDPTETFVDEIALKKRITSLVEANKIVMNTVQIFEVKKQSTATIKISLNVVK